MLNIKLIYIFGDELQIYSYFLVTNAAPNLQFKIAPLETHALTSFFLPHWFAFQSLVARELFRASAFNGKFLAHQRFCYMQTLSYAKVK